MARKIIVLDVSKSASGDYSVRCAFWLTAPANRVVPKPASTTSMVVNATAPEIAAIVAGTIVEQIVNDSGAFPAATTLASAQATLVTQYNAAQAALTATAAGVAAVGLAWDGSVWA